MDYRQNVRRTILWIIDAREGGSPSSFGKRIGRIRQRVNSWKKGETVPDLDTVVTICNEYDLSMDFVIGGDLEKAPVDYYYIELD